MKFGNSEINTPPELVPPKIQFGTFQNALQVDGGMVLITTKVQFIPSPVVQPAADEDSPDRYEGP